MAPDSTLAVTPLTAPAAVPAAYHDPAHAPPPHRARETTPAPSTASADDLSPARIARLASYTRQLHSPPTAAAVPESKRRRPDEETPEHSMNNPENKRRRLTEPNAADLTHQELAQLMAGATTAPPMSRPQDTVTADGQLAVEAAAAAAARALGTGQINTNTSPEMHDISPQSAVSAGSGASLDEGDSHVVHSPGQMDADGRAYTQQPDAPMDGKTANSLSYPGLPGAPMQGPEGPQRGMSLPMTGSQNPELTPPSPPSGGRKHKCPHCPAEFTRHHNLKSHLLIHSQEKPYSCQQCTARFRRLHDLKRHSKLHTGEKPHMCPKCHRTFARGDALARHSKGIGGCAGKRASVENFMGEEDFDSSAMDGDDSAMAGVLYEASADASMTEDGRRRQSMPSIKAQHVAGQAGQDAFINHSNTYPPTGVRPPPGLYPPGVDRVSTSSTTSPTLPSNHTPQTSISSMPLSAGSSSMFSQTGMTESPKPLSPGSVQTNQAGQKRASTQQSAPGLSQPPHGNAAAPSAAVRGRPRGSSGAGGRQASNGVAADPSSLYSPNPTLMQFYHDLEDRIKKLTADLEAKNASEAQMRERIAQQDHSITTLQAEVADLRRQQSGPAQGDVAGPE